MNKKYLYIAGGVFACLLLLSTCNDDTQTVATQPLMAQPQYQGQPQPVVVQNPAPVVVNDGGNGGFFSGLMMGHMLSGHSSHSTHTTVVNRYTTKRYYGSRPAYRSRATSRSFSRRR